MYIIDRLWALQNNSPLNSPDYTLAGFFLNPENQKVRHTLTAVQELTYVSKSSIDRFCKTGGFSSLRIFERALAAELSETETKALKYSAAGLNKPDYSEFIKSSAVQKWLDQTHNALKKADRIYIIGRQKSIMMLSTMITACIISGRQVILLNSWSLSDARHKLTLCRENDFLLAIDTDFDLSSYEVRLQLEQGVLNYSELAGLPCPKAFIGKKSVNSDSRFNVLGMPSSLTGSECCVILLMLDHCLFERMG